MATGVFASGIEAAVLLGQPPSTSPFSFDYTRMDKRAFPGEEQELSTLAKRVRRSVSEKLVSETPPLLPLHTHTPPSPSYPTLELANREQESTTPSASKVKLTRRSRRALPTLNTAAVLPAPTSDGSIAQGESLNAVAPAPEASSTGNNAPIPNIVAPVLEASSTSSNAPVVRALAPGLADLLVPPVGEFQVWIPFSYLASIMQREWELRQEVIRLNGLLAGAGRR
ncbi:hypothetical protein BXZ70DRAFT_1009901 [Cristinia sonorae]|uniref:Uncharacterized protein n=1 Tax=Cristinia sonorae TaxID=1940300 RepID=A0A8K0UL31_9AGAR|nr:hypothetical protein BXZ70DRAFT_1009901 [Cristinia sonorae]